MTSVRHERGGRTPRGARRALVVLLPLVVLGGGLGGAAWWRYATAPLNVVLIGIDTLRADHLGCYGYPRPTSPRIDALARDSALFATAIAPAPWTLPSFASMLTGLVPSHHRAGEGSPTGGAGLDASHPTLATILRDAGFATASFVSNGWVSTRVGLARGFDEHAISGSADAAASGVRWIAGRPAGRPFFLFVHLLAPHAPYDPPAEDAEPFVDATYDPRAIIRIDRATMNGAPCPSQIAVAGERLQRFSTGVPPWLVLRSAATTSPTANVPLLPKGAPTRLVVAYVAPPAPPAIEFDETLHQHLRELGYLP